MKNYSRFVLYARKSSEREDRQVQSIDDQISYWKKRAKEDGIEIVKVYTEEKSAKMPWVRKAFYEMCEYLEKWWIDGILCWKLDRLARNPVDAGNIQYMLQRWRIQRVITSDRIYHPEDAGLIFSVETGMANQYIIDLSKNVKRWLKSKIEKWDYPCKAPQWYINDPLTRKIAIDKTKYDLVKKMWELLLTGCYAPSKIAHIANTEWWYSTTDTTKKARHELAVSTIYTIFNNPFYAGYFKYNGKLVKGSHEPMITWEQYEKAQSLISHTKASPNISNPERPQTLSFPYTGVIRCWCCGCTVTAVKKYKTLKTSGEVKEYTYYHCTHKKDTPDFRCDQRKVLISTEIDAQIHEMIASMDIVPEFYEWAKNALKRKHSEEINTRESVYDSVNKSLESAEKKRNRLIDMRLGGEFDDDYGWYDTLKKQIDEEIEKLQIRRNELEKESIDWNDLIKKTFDFAKYASEIFKSGDIEKKKMIFRALGWNWILKDGKLEANLHDWFLPFVKYNKLQLSPLQRLEPNEKSIPISKDTEWDAVIPIWWRLVEEVRTALMSQESIPYIPKLG